MHTSGTRPNLKELRPLQNLNFATFAGFSRFAYYSASTFFAKVLLLFFLLKSKIGRKICNCLEMTIFWNSLPLWLRKAGVWHCLYVLATSAIFARIVVERQEATNFSYVFLGNKPLIKPSHFCTILT